ncbi:uncharacterized protein LOC114786743 [Denticeps clupeoides]|uniref:uncharacterized protein LOC114786743 n=1 Tax=Denticeps clupeoides TaxID=299321 RepID=UPI0010A59378|nr:uncharacterized protein LOC114786743 [Denticeps clupeoides]
MNICSTCWLVVWFSLVSHSYNELVSLKTLKEITGKCHKKVVLPCDISIKAESLNVTLFSWISDNTKKTLCDVKNTESSMPHFSCAHEDRSLVLTIHHARLADEGNYLCKLRSSMGIKQTWSKVNLQDCHSKSHYDPLRRTCHASGIYPQGQIHWSHHHSNLTHNSTLNTTQAADGTYELISTLHHDLHHDYNCSLWFPRTGTKIQILPRQENDRATQAITLVKSVASGTGTAWRTLALLLVSELLFH